jgi:L-iditol 2-dehydrogenase
MEETMRAAMIHGPGELRIDEVPRPEPRPGQLLIRIRACGVCPSDVRGYTGERKSSQYPRGVGHEWCGDVVALGEGVAEFGVGDRVAPDWRVICGRCYYCRRGIFNYCQNLAHGQVRGGFAEYGVAPVANLRRVPEPVSYHAACFTEPLACCLNGIAKNGIRMGDDVVIVGAGQIGLMHLQLARHHGGRVIVCDTLEARLLKAQELGAHATINVAEGDAVERARELTEGRGANAVIVAVGAPAAIELGLQVAGICASVNLFAGTYPPATLPLDPNLIHYKQLSLVGSHDFTPHDFTTALKLLATGVVRVEPLISHVLPLEETERAFRMVAERQGLKLMIAMPGPGGREDLSHGGGQ